MLTLSVPTANSDSAWFGENDSRRRHVLLLRAAALRAVRTYFDDRAYIEVQTPVMVPSPGTEVHLDAFEVRGHPRARWLITSPEYQMKRLLSGGFDRIYQIGPCFRRNEQGSYHQPEFTMVEWYQVGGTYADLLEETENLVSYVAERVLGSASVKWKGQVINLTPPWPRLSVIEAFDTYAHADALKFAEHEELFFRTLIDKVEPHLGQEKPCFLYDFPATMASLALLHAANPKLAARTEAYMLGVELCNGYVELTDADEQRRRHENDTKTRRQLNKPHYPIDERFLAALMAGIPPCVGMALGFDRLMMLLANTEEIQDVVAFSDARL
ncbi:MAG: EF-P lysine aminoacylase GenX [Myxococcales bacterium]|nr:EF-P lysine aminoacylase GenX [Myxococcales bacterium]MCB9708239.1 EF-P lysine aminoacylase GenX [Myxococcales bacterium]